VSSKPNTILWYHFSKFRFRSVTKFNLVWVFTWCVFTFPKISWTKFKIDIEKQKKDNLLCE
jgi:hypothetical protein